MEYVAFYTTVHKGQTMYVHIKFESDSPSRDRLEKLASETLRKALKSDEARSLDWRLNDLRPFVPATE